MPCAPRVCARRGWYVHDVPERLVLWDVDHTLLNAGGLSSHLYGVAFRRIFGRELETVAPMAGRTDRAIILDTLTRAGVPEPDNHLCDFAAELGRQAPEFGRRVGERGRALPGAADALRALAADHHGAVVQSVLTGNLRPLAEVKLGALDLTQYLDLDIGAYGDVHEVRAELVHVARGRAAAAYGVTFPGEKTVIVGDTPYDVGAAVATGARAIGVATGATPARELAAAGASAVLADLTDTAAVVAAILG
jgi:phosphoglycolate phosphatase